MEITWNNNMKRGNPVLGFHGICLRGQIWSTWCHLDHLVHLVPKCILCTSRHTFSILECPRTKEGERKKKRKKQDDPGIGCGYETAEKAKSNWRGTKMLRSHPEHARTAPVAMQGGAWMSHMSHSMCLIGRPSFQFKSVPELRVVLLQ